MTDRQETFQKSTDNNYGSIPLTDPEQENEDSGLFAYSSRSSRGAAAAGGLAWSIGGGRRESSSLRGTRFVHSVRESIGASVSSLVDMAFVLDGVGERCSVRDMGGQASIASEVANISKNLIGGGILSLSGGISLYSNAPSAVVPASLWLVLLGAIFGYFCWLIAKVCKMTRTATYREVWQETMGDGGSLAVALSTTLKAGLGNLAYSLILSQTATSLAQAMGFNNISRLTCLFVITLFAILPLCLLKNLHVLAPFSILGMAAVTLTGVAMTVRYLDGSYKPGGQFYDDIDPTLRPSFGNDNRAWSPAILPFVCMCFESFVMHYNAPRFFVELKDATMPRFGLAVGYSFGISALFYIVIASVGFLTFGGNCDSLILNNYSPHDNLATASRIAIALSTLLTYPIVFIGFRDGMLDFLQFPIEKQTEANINLLTIILLAIITLIAVFVTDLGQINAIGGGTLATLICILFPALMYREAAKYLGTPRDRQQVILVMILMVFGLVLGIIGVWEALFPDA